MELEKELWNGEGNEESENELRQMKWREDLTRSRLRERGIEVPDNLVRIS